MKKLKTFGVFMLIVAVLLFLAVLGFFLVPLMFIIGGVAVAWLISEELTTDKPLITNTEDDLIVNLKSRINSVI